ncbi:hypothetical protein ES705_18130 [subsurface metagenome]
MNERSKLTDNKPDFFENEEIDLFEYLITVLKHWKIILGVFVVTVVIAVIVSLNITPMYRAFTTILPVSSESNIWSILPTLSGPVVGGNESNYQKIIAILNSRTLMESVIRSLNLIDIRSLETPVNEQLLSTADGIFQNKAKVSSDRKTGLIVISVEHEDRELAAKIANQYVKELELSLREKSFTALKMYRVFIEEQLKLEEDKLKKYQEEMSSFQKESKIIEPVAQLKGTMDIYSNLVSQKINLEIELKKIEAALSEDNPRIIAIQNQLEAIKYQINKIEESTQEGAFTSFINAPDQMFEYSELLRKMNTSQSIHDSLTEMYEKARFEEIKESLYVEVIDPAITPTVHFKPNKRKIVKISGSGSIIFGIFLVLFINWINKKIKSLREERKSKS